jgi:hypothetical protein
MKSLKLCLEAFICCVTGYSNKEFDAIADEDYYHPDYLEYAHNKIKELKYPDITIPALFQVKHKDGRYG